MKILQVVPYFYPAWSYGGPAKLVKDLSESLSDKGHQVSVYTSDAYDANHRMPFAKRLPKRKNFIVRYFRNISNTWSFRHHIFIAPMIFFKVLLELPSFDVIHIHDFYILSNIWISILCRLLHKPYVISVHGCLEERRMEEKKMLKKLFLNIYGISMLRRARALVATSENEKKAYISYKIPESKIFSIGHGINIQEFYTEKSKDICRKSFKLSKTSFVITYIGRIHKIKGLDLLVRAVALMKNDRIKVVIAGSDDGFLTELNKIISKNNMRTSIQVLGPCYGIDKTELFKASDLFIYPSYSEGFSLGILEAGGAGLPLLITKGCHFNIGSKWKAGLVVESTPNALAKGIQYMFIHKNERKLFGQNAKKMVKKEYDMSHISDDFHNFYKNCLEEDCGLLSKW